MDEEEPPIKKLHSRMEEKQVNVQNSRGLRYSHKYTNLKFVTYGGGG